MSTFTIHFRTDNDAFRREDGTLRAFDIRETVLDAMRKLIDVAWQIEPGSLTEVRLFDRNGNRVGEMTIDEVVPEGDA